MPPYPTGKHYPHAHTKKCSPNGTTSNNPDAAEASPRKGYKLCDCGCEILNMLDDDVTECVTETWAADHYGPAEYCERDTIPGTSHCPKHQGDTP